MIGWKVSGRYGSGLENPMGGVKIIESDLALEKTNEPIRKHELKNWMSGTYHNRIQKKWNKRFGFVMKPCIFKTPYGYIAHPTLAHQIRWHFMSDGMKNMLAAAQS